MKGEYRGHEIEVTRERCMGGWDLAYYSICVSDGYEMHVRLHLRRKPRPHPLRPHEGARGGEAGDAA